MFVIEPWGRAQKAHVLIGSANATDAAFSRNVEFLVELRGPRKHLGIDAFLGPDAEFATLLAEYEPVGGVDEDPKAEEERRLENALRAVAEIPHRVLVEPSGRRAGCGDEPHADGDHAEALSHSRRLGRNGGAADQAG